MQETDAAEAAVERRYGSWRMLARHVEEASRRADAFARLELALARLSGEQQRVT